MPESCAGGLAVASMTNTSLSGRENFTLSVHERPRESTQSWPLNRTSTEVSGAGLPSALTLGPGTPPAASPPLGTMNSCTTVERFPEWNAAAYTREPSGVAASARGVSLKRVTIFSGLPPSEVPRLLASKTQTSARPTPGVVNCGSNGTFCPRWAAVMKARLFHGPAKTMSRGSSPTSSVRTTEPARPSALCRTMLTLSDRWLTTQTSSSLRAATATGSSPTGTDEIWVRVPAVTWKISRRLSGVLTA